MKEYIGSQLVLNRQHRYHHGNIGITTATSVSPRSYRSNRILKPNKRSLTVFAFRHHSKLSLLESTIIIRNKVFLSGNHGPRVTGRGEAGGEAGRKTAPGSEEKASGRGDAGGKTAPDKGRDAAPGRVRDRAQGKACGVLDKVR